MQSPYRARLAHTALVVCAALLAACAAPEPPLPDYRNIVVAADRLDADRVLDQRRKPEQLLEFYGVRPGMRVLDVSAGRGYNSELLARAVGPAGRVYAHTSPSMSFPAAKAALEERLKRPVMRNAVLVNREFEDPVPPDVRNLDLVTFNFNYHDVVWLGTDRARMNRAIFQALKPGGVYIVADHSAKPGAGVSVAKSLHRIEESVVRQEVLAAGFKLVSVGDFLRNPADPRDVPVQKNTVPNDEFVLKFVRP
ncbi:MAG TPA: methyltransferase domain-containing protein [Burkholderiales bacterium]|nr:methyltransferase domain-containing protein [Burkholderiales bacterium]